MKALILMFTAILTSLSSYCQITNHIDSVIKSHIRPGEPGIAFRLEIEGKLLYNKGFGLANVHTKTPITPETNFRMASVSKQFTAMAILLLEKDGKLSFNDPLTKFLPEIPQDVGEKVLVRHLLTHSSGIIDYEAVMDTNSTEQLLDDDVLRILKNQDTTYFRPGTQFRYSNSAYCLMTIIVERVSGQNYPAFMKEKIFKPLGMNSTTVYEASREIAQRAMGYARNKDGEIYFSDQSLTSATKGDGGVYTSPADYAKWNNALQTNVLVDLSAVANRLNFKIPDLSHSYYNAGWFMENSGNTTFFHSGSTCGFSTFVIRIPEQKACILYFSNIAGNETPFRDIMQMLSELKVIKAEPVMALHALTR